MRLPAFGVKFPITNLMIFFAILILGGVSLSKLPIDLMPEIEPPVISVITVYEGASAEDVETKVTEVIENNLATVSNLDKLTSRSSEGLSTVSCRFNWGTNLDEASNDVRDKLEFAKRLLPDEIETPIVFKFNTALIPIVFIGVSAPDDVYPQLYHLVDKQVGDYLKRIPGVGAVQIIGGLERQININLDRARLEAYNISPQLISDRLAQENITLPAGDLKTGYLDFDLRVPGEFTDPAQIKDIIINQEGGKIVYLKDVADVSDSFKEVTMIVRSNGEPAVMLMVQKRSGANTVEVANRIKSEIKKIENRLPNIEFSILMDSSEHISQSIKDLTKTIYWGGIFVILVVFLFLRQIRPSIIIALSIPFSLIIAFIFMYLFKFTLNIMSLSSLAIAIGMVVDNAIVIVDNVYRHRERGQKPKEAAIYGASEVGLAVTASTLTTVVVFFPFVFLTGITGVMFKQLAALITITLLASLFTALTFSPMLCSKLLVILPEEKLKQGNSLFARFYQISAKFFESLESGYSRFLGWTLRNKKLTILIATIIFVFSLLLIPKIGTEFVPEEDTGDLSIQIELPVGTRVEETNKVSHEAEAILKNYVPEAKTIFARVGQSGGSRFAGAFGQRIGSNVITVGAKLSKIDERKRTVKEISQSIRPKISSLLGVKKINIQAGSPFSRLLFGGGKPISVEILGHDLEATDKLAYELKSEINKIEGVVDATISRELGKPELQIEVDRLKASSLGVSMNTLTDTLRTYFYGKTASKYRQSGEEYDIFVRLKESDRQSIKDIDYIPIILPDGKIIKLNNIAKVVPRTGPISIERQNQERIIKIEANTFRRSLGEIAKDIRNIIAKTKIPPDVVINLGSDIEEQAKSFRDLLLLLVLGAILVYMVMASQFESLLEPFIVMFSVPFAFTGVAFGLFLGNISLSVISFLGLVMLIGIVVNNAIVLVDYINILAKRGIPLTQAITTGGKNRLRPVLMTTITTLLGMLPLAISRGEGSELWRPLGVSMIGGLSLSTFITLVLVPVLYAIFKTRFKRA
ncbi:MAG: efflux RND transporter permease subunit [Candidatus Omnitrophota bacterium]